MNLIAFVGFIGSGKDTASKHLVTEHFYKPIAFADALKDCVSSIFCWPRDMIEGESAESRVWRNQVDVWWAERLGIPHFTPRFALQNFGTEIMRNHFNTDVWMMNVERRIAAMGEGARIVLTDARFGNELALATRLGGKIVRVRRGAEPEWYGAALDANINPNPLIREANRTLLTEQYKVHESEWAWIGYDFDAVIDNNGTIDDLHRAAEDLMR